MWIDVMPKVYLSSTKSMPPPRASSRTSRVLEVHPLDLEKQGLAQDVQRVVHLGQEAGHGHLAEQREEV